MGINSHGNEGLFPFPWRLFPIPIKIPTIDLIFVPFPWDSHRIPIPIGNPIPMVISTNKHSPEGIAVNVILQ